MNYIQNDKARQKVLACLKDDAKTTSEIVQETGFPFFMVNIYLEQLRDDHQICSRNDTHYIPTKTGVEYLFTFILLLVGLLSGCWLGGIL